MNPKTTAIASTAIKNPDIQFCLFPSKGGKSRTRSRGITQLLYLFVRDLARFRVCLQHFTYRLQFPDFRFSKNHSNYVRNLSEMDTAIEKRGDRDLVGGVQGNSFCTPSLRCFIGQAETGEFSHVRRLEIEVS